MSGEQPPLNLTMLLRSRQNVFPLSSIFFIRSVRLEARQALIKYPAVDQLEVRISKNRGAYHDHVYYSEPEHPRHLGVDSTFVFIHHIATFFYPFLSSLPATCYTVRSK